MNLHDTAALLLYAFLTTLLGAVLTRRLPVGVGAGSRLALSYLCGQMLWLLLLLVGGFVGVPVRFVVCCAPALAAVILLVFYVRSRPARRMSFRWWLVLLPFLLTLLCFPQLVYSVLRVPLVGWDARSIWFFHAKAIFVDSGISGSFFGDSAYAWSHTDYPLLLPVQGAVVCFLRGSWSEMAAKSFLLLNFVAWFSLLLDVLRSRGWDVFMAWCMAILVLTIGTPAYVDGYADNHYSMPLLLALLLAFRGDSRDGGSTVAGILAVYALNVKNEAALYLAVGVVVWLAVRYWRDGRDGLRPRGVPVAVYVGLAAFLLWGLFKAIHGISGDLQLGMRALHPFASLVMVWQRLPLILGQLAVFYRESRLGLILVAVLAMLLYRRVVKNPAGGVAVEERVFWLLLVLSQVMIIAVYGITPYDPQWHIATSLERVMLLPRLIAMALFVCEIERFREQPLSSVSV